MKNYITQYKVVFCLSWVVLYLIFPSWISKHLIFQEHGFPNVSYPVARSLVIFGYTMYFSISAYFLNRYFNALTVNKSFIIKIDDLFAHIKNNLGLVIVCCLSVVLHIYSSLSVIVLSEERTLEQTFWMYDILNEYWHNVFDFPIQYLFWAVVFLMILAKKKNLINPISNYSSRVFSTYKSNYLIKLFLIFLCFCFFSIYSQVFPYYSFSESMQLVRYPPVSRFLNLTTYFAFGISHTGPRILQFTFYVLSAIYLYRTILLFCDKETALLGSTIYLFSPIVYSYAFTASPASGTVFFAILISYYFLRFLKEEDDRDLLLATYFIGVGFMYKRGILLMFVICFTYLALSKLMKRDFSSLLHFKVLLLSLIPILPWLKIGPVMYFPVWSHLITYSELVEYFMMIKSQISAIVVLLLLISFVSAFINRRNELSKFFGYFFIAYYLFFTLTEQGDVNHRFVLVLYPAIAVFLAQVIVGIANRIRWKYSVKLFTVALSIYLIGICLIPRSSSSIITYKYKDFETQHFPIDKATDWIKNNTENNEKVLVLFMIPYKLYVDRIYPEKNNINSKRFIFKDIGTNAKEIIFPLQNLKRFCYEEEISYIMFPFGPNNNFPNAKPLLAQWEMRKYLNENMDNDFVRVAKFSIEDNYIFMYRPKDF